VRDGFFRHLGGVNFTGTPALVLAAQLVRVVARHPVVLTGSAGWAVRVVRRVGLRVDRDAEADQAEGTARRRRRCR